MQLLKRIYNDTRTTGILLLACTAVSLLLGNLFGAYPGIWEQEWHWLQLLQLPHSPVHLVNDGGMALFFFLAGMEIKRELQTGELSTPQRAALPAAAAIGGMVVPAVIYILFNKGTANQHGWGIPMATDIAFSLGILALLGKRIQVSLRIFLTALAIIDDLGAIIVIALFYGGAIQWLWLLVCAAVTAVLYYSLRGKTTMQWWHYLLGLVLWFAMYHSGVHATVAGVLFALLVPAQQIKHLEHRLHAPVNFILLPLFALANTAIHFPDHLGAALNTTVSWGIVAGLFIGKPLGICGTCYLLVKKGYGTLPSHTGWMQLAGVGILAGIGFTMSIFISTLAFAEPAGQNIAKIAVLLASVLAMITGYCWLLFANRPRIK
ncbi:Na+/H+ antiporter NhaA [Deminuibacter soli]|uniref:Na(+)/H(+) antiporter NhaA n=1 Tax=Deminuibacter soli TaxID=2291815 RepID=A0A3E1NGU3_9BACT|nr:Na+/H+ antiporter NhaA [Deminuibacter soli]RFM27102.1 Na+/H+ antiporter NhaA [Deminuibacter soli]